MKKIIVFSISVMLIIASCYSIYYIIASKESNHYVVEEGGDLPADFKFFFEKFNQDEQYQKDHVLFPFIVRVEDDDDDMDQITSVEREDWDYFFSYSHEKYIIFFYLLSNHCVACNIQLYDTGLWLQLLFQRINGEWYCTEFLDAST